MTRSRRDQPSAAPPPGQALELAASLPDGAQPGGTFDAAFGDRDGSVAQPFFVKAGVGAQKRFNAEAAEGSGVGRA